MRRVAATRGRQRRWFALAAEVSAAAAVAAAPQLARGQSDDAASSPLPFAVGERLNYRVRVGPAGSIGKGSMWIEGPVDVRGQQTYLLRSDFQARVMWIRAFDKSDTWLDPARMAVLRSSRIEQQPLSKSNELVDVFPEERRWADAGGAGGETASDAPLDELSFIYYIRTLCLAPDSAYSVNRHYDIAKNPVSIRVTGRQVVATDAGTFNTVVVEMRVKDPRHFKGEGGLIKLFLSDDRRHLPVRIESDAPLFGKAVFTLESVQTKS